MNEGIDLSAEIKAICEKLGHEHHRVAELIILPDKVIASVYDGEGNIGTVETKVAAT